MKAWLKVAEAAEYAGVSRDTIYTACERRELGHARVGGRRSIRLKPEWIDAWLEQHTRSGRRSSRERASVPVSTRQTPASTDFQIEDSTLRANGSVTTARTGAIRGSQHGSGDGC
jgi:excisionase family DNA binding protein